MARINKSACQIANREDQDQTASSKAVNMCLFCLSRPFWQTTSFQKFSTYLLYVFFYIYLATPGKKELRFSRDATFRTIHSASTRESALSVEHPQSALSIQGIGMTKEETFEYKGNKTGQFLLF